LRSSRRPGAPGAEPRPARCRLDQLLQQRGLAPSRAAAQAYVLAGRVFSGAERLDKPGTRLPHDAPLALRPGAPFVGRGGVKLAGALERFGLGVAGLDVLDVGASTGGFTDALLRAGAGRVIALDVGRGQLDWSLRNDPRVHALEGVNARRLEPARLPFVPALAVIDVSFISLRLVLPAVVNCLAAGGEVVALVKPQFEVGRAAVGRGGIVRDGRLHHDVLLRIAEFARERGWGVADVCASPLRGSDGNREFFLRLRPDGGGLERAERERRIAAALAERDPA